MIIMITIIIFNNNTFLRMGSIGLVLWGVGAILGNEHGIQGQIYTALLLGSEMSVGFYHRNLIIGIQCFRLIT